MLRKNYIRPWGPYEMRAMATILKAKQSKDPYAWKVLLFLVLSTSGIVSLVSLVIIISERFFY